MEIVDNKALLVTVRNPKRFTDVMPNSVNLGEVSEGIYELMVKWDFDNACALTKLGLKKYHPSLTESTIGQASSNQWLTKKRPLVL